MGAVMKLFSCGVRQVFRDGMLALLLPAPFLMGAVLWFGLPLADSVLVREAGVTIRPWFMVSDAFVMVMTAIMTGMICAFLLLDERDESIGLYYRITPMGGRSYLAARLGIPMMWAFLTSLIVIGFFALAMNNFTVMLVSALLATFQGVIACMLLAVMAGNKVEGLALAKIVNIMILGLPAAWFISAPYKYLLFFLPSFWMGEFIFRSTEAGISQALLPGLAGAIASLIWIVILTRAFLNKTKIT